jgi:hypothetical protein
VKKVPNVENVTNLGLVRSDLVQKNFLQCDELICSAAGDVYNFVAEDI